MESLNTKDFLEKLKNNSFKSTFSLVGIVKKSDKDNEILFAGKHNFNHWVAIPASMVESVTVLKSIPWGNNQYTFVKLNLNTPTNPETKTLYDLLQGSSMGHGHHHLSGMGDMLHALWHSVKSDDGFCTQKIAF